MVVLLADLALRLHPFRPRDDARVGRAAVELVALPHLERRVERHRPAVGVVVVGLGAAELVEQREVLLHRVRDAVGDVVLVHRPVRAALSARAVVGDQQDQRVLALLGLLQIVQQPPDLVIGVRHEPGINLRHPAEQPLLVGRQRVPRPGHVQRRERLPVRSGLVGDRVDRRELGIGRDDPQLLLAGERLLADRLVAHVELALELRDPLLRHLVRRMAGAGRVVEEERLLRRDHLGVLDELERLVGQIHGQVVALAGERGGSTGWLS